MADSALKHKVLTILGAAYGGEHNIPGTLRDRGHFCEINVPCGIATYDGDTLTRLVFGAHDLCVRLEIARGGPREIKLLFHARKRVGRLYDRHPTLSDAIVNIGSLCADEETFYRCPKCGRGPHAEDFWPFNRREDRLECPSCGTTPETTT